MYYLNTPQKTSQDIMIFHFSISEMEAQKGYLTLICSGSHSSQIAGLESRLDYCQAHVPATLLQGHQSAPVDPSFPGALREIGLPS